MTTSSKRQGNVNNLIQPLLTDKYQVSMCYAYWKDNKHNEQAVFDLYFRKNPFRGEYTIFAGLDECLTYIEHFKFNKEDIDYLKAIPDYCAIEGEFWTYLENLSTKTIKIYALREGSVCFPNLPLVRVEGPLGLLQLIETTLLNQINYASLVTTNAARFKMAAGIGNEAASTKMPDCKLLEFGLRRAQGADGGLSASRYSYIGGFDATSNLLAGKEFGIPVCGTMSHAFIMAYFGTTKLDRQDLTDHKTLLNKRTNKLEDFTQHCLDVEEDFMQRHSLGRKKNETSEFKAFIIFAWAFPDTFLALVDTYDVIRSGLINFCVVAIALIHFGYKPIGIRIDSGDLAYLSRSSKEFFEKTAAIFALKEFNHLEIVASNDINEDTIISLKGQQHSITSLGIGTHLVTCQSQPALGCVYKLVQTNETPCMKLSSTPEKVTIPGKKSAYRLYGREGKALIDLLVLDSEPKPTPGKKILCRHPFVYEKRCNVEPSRVEPLLHLWWDGAPTQELPSLAEARDFCAESLKYFTEDISRSLNPTPYKVSVSEELFNLLNELKLDLIPIGELS